MTTPTTPSRRRATFDPGRSQMDIMLKADGTPVLFTWYKGHRFYGWIDQSEFDKVEADGTLSWDGQGNPVIKIPVYVATPTSEPTPKSHQ